MSNLPALSIVTNFAAFRRIATVPSPDRMGYFTRGRQGYGDAGMGLYGWSPASTDADDDDAVIKPDDRSGSDPGRWVRVSLGAGLPFAFDQWNRSEDLVNNAGQVGATWAGFVGPADAVTEGGFGTPDYDATRIAGRPAAVFNPATFDLLEYNADIETGACDQLHVFVVDPDYHCAGPTTERYYLASSANNLHIEAMFCAHTVNAGSALLDKWAGFSNSAADGDPDIVNVLWHPFKQPGGASMTHAVRGPQIVTMELYSNGTSRMVRSSMWGETAEVVGESVGYDTQRGWFAGSLRHAIGAGDNADGISIVTHFRGAMSEIAFKNLTDAGFSAGSPVPLASIQQIHEYFRNKYPFADLGYKAPSMYFVKQAALTTFGGGAWFEWNHRISPAEWVCNNSTAASQATGANQPAVSNGVAVFSPGGGTKSLGGSDLPYCMTVSRYRYFILMKLVSATLTNANRWTNHHVFGDNAGNVWLTADAVGGGATRNLRGGHFGGAPASQQWNATAAITPGTWVIVDVNYQNATPGSATGVLTIAIDGTIVETVNNVTDINGSLATRPLRIGDNAVGQGVDAKIAEIICYPGNPSAQCVIDVMARLNDVRTQVIALGE
jgi:hypothetical protein